MTSVKIVLYTSKTLSNGKHPVMLRITRDRKHKYMSTGISLYLEEWDDKKDFIKPKIANHLEIKMKLLKAEADMQKLVLNEEIEENTYSLGDLQKSYKGDLKKITVDSFIESIVQEYMKAGNIGNAKAYKWLKSRLNSYNGGKELTFAEINGTFLHKLELHFREKGLKDTTMSFYMRTLRAVYNKAVLDKYAKAKDYPFDKFHISKFKTETAHRAISKEEIRAVMNLEIGEGSRIYNSRNYFIFSYLTRGINFKDIALLKWEDIKNDRLIYQRAKTRSIHNVKLSPAAVDILNYYKDFKTTSTSPYIFPILSEKHSTPVSIDNRIHKLLGQTNLDLKDLGKKAKIETTLTTYVARHSYATSLKTAGHRISMISESLGHKSEKTTQIYLDSISNTLLDDAEKDLL